MGKTVIFELPYPPTKKGMAAWNKRFSLNAYWAGKHYRARAKDAQDVHAMTVLALRQARIKKECFKGPVEVVFQWDDRLDIDNHAALGKMIVDALKGYVIKDDSPRWVRRTSHEFWDGRCIRVTVREVEEC